MILNKRGNNIIIQPTPTTIPLPTENYKRPKLLARLFHRKKPTFVWCFRSTGTSSFNNKPSISWVEFEKKNQFELSRQLNLTSSRDDLPPASFEIQDRRIFNNKVTITVILREGIAFALDPEWSKPITFEITCRPKLNWYRAIFMRMAY